MNQLEINLALWAICSILLFEILIIICLCRCCFNRIRPRKFYVKREECEYLHDVQTGIQSKFQSTILRPPHADELALVGTIRGSKPAITYNDGFQNPAFSPDDEQERIRRAQSQNWIELQSNIIRTAQLPPADYEIRTRPIADDMRYAHARPPAILDFHSLQEDFSDEKSDFENFRFQPLRRPTLILPPTPRVDTSTECHGIQYSNTVPKSILKTPTNPSPSRSRTSSKYEDSPYVSAGTNTDRSTNMIERRFPSQSNLSPALPSPPAYRMRFASVSELNDVEWEVPREFHTTIRDRPKSPTDHIDSRSRISWQRETNSSQPYSLLRNDPTQQQAFEY
ncbi:unnamed protein product [Adineta ricciae]|uniref:Uncharacterized protein n=1 Tax=Adineta ricciae TaxID=249248 RepID=A0A813WY28_ADIRI|nr:unnamed protein product [Adineta ricciae]CAF0878613.1 unnamed protein product [Adineta ricciae]